MKTTSVLGLLAAAASVSAHATFQQLWVNGVDQGSTCVRTPVSNSPVSSVTSNDIRCNAGTAGVAGVCTVPAGGTVTIEMHQQPGDRTCTTEAIGGNHDGPVIAYLSKVSDATTADGSSSWFKIYQNGLVSTDYWGTDVLNANCGKQVITIPADIAPGDYLLRAEVIALHVASSTGGAQFYLSCYQLRVTGGGSANPAGVLFPGAYSASDPGILFNLYASYTSYTVPGPAVYAVGGATASATASATGTTTAAAATSSAAAAGNIAKYGQCGGNGWTGTDTCSAGSTCTKVNDYYSQCL
ncbi:uncharacterized protein LAJ45_03878 [Morchella importuna]|uniref:AA9 family lytic polysaccharide monooxygenase n=1 Tax=Morchella conica CCBAS932 TaxID=1392247 RepID=A0A3N4L1H9_9PEZI|nr:uncharacterized protein LAJ45_03878 [Morchella importuna]KAH8151885.1 hypothetical protein LAJ45_03878 [Morchella importuna]RPB16674.1 glycoside hydrolase family 61 protein [Morchella conica CCBAS932]